MKVERLESKQKSYNSGKKVRIQVNRKVRIQVRRKVTIQVTGKSEIRERQNIKLLQY